MEKYSFCKKIFLVFLVTLFVFQYVAILPAYAKDENSIKENIINCDLNNFENWRFGRYCDNGKYSSWPSFLCLKELKICNPGATYRISISDRKYVIILLQLDKDLNPIQTRSLYDGGEFTMLDSAKYLGISLYTPSSYQIRYNDYKKLFENGFKLGITEIKDFSNYIEKTNLSNSGLWRTGKFSLEKATHQLTTSAICLYEFKDCKPNTEYTYSTSDDKFRLLVRELDSSGKVVKSSDLANGQVLKTQETTKKVAISLYNPSNYSLNFSKFMDTFKNGLKLSFTLNNENIEDDEKIVLKEELSNFNNYQVGWYYSYGGYYDSTPQGTYCTKELYRIENKTYTININDSRAKISIQEYDENGKWLKLGGTFENGQVWTPQSKTAYIGITVNSVEWAVKVKDLLTNGLSIYFADKLYENGTEIIDMNSFNFSDSNNWRAGEYSSKTGEFGINPKKLATSYFLNVENDNSTYMVDLDNGYLKMVITEMDSNGNVITKSELQSGQKWTRNSKTSYIGIHITSSKNYEYADFKKLFENGCNMCLKVFTPYNHNTEMKDITANEFVSYMNIGWNLGNSLDSHYGDRTGTGVLGQERTWGNVTITKDLIDYVHELGFNTIRIPVTWYYNTYTDEQGNLHIVQQWLERVQEVVDYAISNDMYVIINTHHEQPIIYAGTDDETFKQVLSDAQDLWYDISYYFKDYDEHLIFESYNEVDNIKTSWSYSDNAAIQMNKLNQVFVDTVRATGNNNKNRLLVVPTLLDGHASNFLNSFVLPKDIVENKIIIQVHNYSNQFDQDIEPLFESLEEYSNIIKAPIIIGEFGTKPSYEPSGYRVQATSNYVARAKAHGIKCIYWDDGNLNNFGLIDRRDFSNSRFDIINALINPVAYETEGKITYNDMSYFAWKTLNQTTGEVKEDKYWGTIITDNNGKPLSIKENSYYMTVALTALDEAANLKIHYVHFYDENNKVIKTYNDSYGYASKTFIIPEGAKYVRVGINNSYNATSKNKYTAYFDENKLSLTIGFLDK